MRKKIVWMIALMMIVAMLAACMPVAPTTAPTTTGEPVAEPAEPTVTAEEATEDLAVVRVGYIPVTIYAPIYVADAKGYFAEEGIDVELMPVQGGSDNVVQLGAGNFDVAGGGIGAGMWNAADRGIQFEIVAPLHAERPPLTTHWW